MPEHKDVDVNKLRREEVSKTFAEEPISEEFMKDHISMVESIASGIVASGKVPPCIDFGDLVSWGVEGLIKAKKNYKEGKGSQFKTYAYYRIRGEMLDKIRSEWHYRNPGDYEAYRKRMRARIAEVAGEQAKEGGKPGSSMQENVKSLIENSGMVYMLSADDVEIVSDKAGTKNPEIEHVDETDSVLWEEIKKLEGEEREIVEMFYVKGFKQIEIAEKLQFSRSKVCRIHMSVLNKLRNRLHKRYNED